MGAYTHVSHGVDSWTTRGVAGTRVRIRVVRSMVLAIARSTIGIRTPEAPAETLASLSKMLWHRLPDRRSAAFVQPDEP